MSKLQCRYLCSNILFNQSSLRHRFIVPGKDFYWFTNKEIESNVSESYVKDCMILITIGTVDHPNP